MRRRFALSTSVLGAVALTAATALAAPPAVAASAETVSCGQLLTHSVRLAADLRDCPGPGLVIGADGITVDLAGHSVSAAPGNDEPGIDNTGHDGVTVKNGAVRDFGVGVVLSDAEGDVVERLAISGRFAGIVLFQADANRVNGVDASSADGDGIAVVESSHNVVDNNHVHDTGFAGISVSGASDANSVADNDVERTFDVGIIVQVRDEVTPIEIPSGNLIESNRVARTSFGILLVETHRTQVQRNIVTAAGTFGDPGAPGGGIGLDSASGTLIARNAVSGNRGNGIEIGGDHPETPTSNVAVANRLLRNGGDGIFVAERAVDTELTRNLAVRNGSDGIEINAAATTVGGNGAFANAQFGIRAVAGVADAGHNRAAGNGDPAQCLNVTCGPEPSR